MRIFITGITGFVGEHLGRELAKRGYEVYGLARYVSNRHATDLSGVSVHYGDILDPIALREIFKDTQPDIIVHLAAQTSVYYSFTHPSEVYNVNFIGVTNVATAAMETIPELKKFIHASSVETYGNQKVFPIKESFPLKPASPYGVAKVAAEYYLKYLYEGYDFPCITFRSTNTYGRGYNHSFVVEHIIYETLKKKEKILMGDPDPVRDFLHIDDEVEAYIKAIETKRDLFGEIMNTGTGREVSIRQLVGIIQEMIGFKSEITWNSISKRPFEIDKLVMDTEKIKELLNWYPKYSLETGLEKTINWWKEYLRAREVLLSSSQ